MSKGTTIERAYAELARALQPGVAQELAMDPSGNTPQRVRAAANVALVGHAALVSLLEAKGVIGREEYRLTSLHIMQAEVEKYAADLSAGRGSQVPSA